MLLILWIVKVYSSLRDDELNNSETIKSFHFQFQFNFSGQKVNALLHPNQTKRLRVLHLCLGNTPPIILHFQNKVTLRLRQGDLHSAGLGMPRD